MLQRRLLAGLVVLAALVGWALPVSGQGKDKKKPEVKKDEGKKDEGKKEGKKEEGKKEEAKGGKTKLVWKFAKDTPFYQKMTTETKQTMKVMNNDVQQTQKQVFYFKWTPIKQDGTKWTIEQSIEGVAMDIDIGGSKISYDSTKESTQNNPLADFFKALVGSKFTITLDTKDLKVTDVEGRDEFLKKLVAANPQMKPLLETILSKDALKEMAEPTFAVVPNKEVAKGYKWDRKTTLNMGPIGQYDNTYDYVYEGPNDKKLQQIKVTTKLLYKPPAESAGQGGLPFKIKGADLKSKSASGMVLFDAAKGRVASSTMKLELEGNLSIEIGGQTTAVKLSQTQESTVETSDTNPIKKQ
jgi:hypothetical protein